MKLSDPPPRSDPAWWLSQAADFHFEYAKQPTGKNRAWIYAQSLSLLVKEASEIGATRPVVAALHRFCEANPSRVLLENVHPSDGSSPIAPARWIYKSLNKESQFLIEDVVLARSAIAIRKEVECFLESCIDQIWVIWWERFRSPQTLAQTFMLQTAYDLLVSGRCHAFRGCLSADGAAMFSIWHRLSAIFLTREEATCSEYTDMLREITSEISKMS